MRILVDVRNAAGASYEPGPIATATRWTGVRRQDRAGTFGFEMPAGDARAALLIAKRYAHCMGMVDETYTEIGAGIIDRLGVAVGARAVPVLSIAGDDLFRELAYQTVGDLVLYDVAAAYSTPNQAYYLGPGEDPNNPTNIRMDAALDGNTGTHYTDKLYYHGNGTVFGDFLYVGHETRFALTRWILNGVLNNNSSTLHAAYFSGAGWTEVAGLSDGTASGGATFAQTGDVTWTRPDADDWRPTSHAGIEQYWIRFWFTDESSENLDTVDFSEIQIKEETPSTTPVADIMAFAPAGWSVVDAGGDPEESDEPTYMVFAGVSVLTALMRLAEVTGEHFRLGTGKKVVWLTSADASGYRAEAGGHGPSLVDNEKVCLIQELTKSEDNYEIISRIYPYGAGRGSGRVTLAAATNSYAGYTVNTADNYIEYDAAEVRIDKVVSWGDIGASDDASVSSEMAANQLADAAHQYLSKHIAAQTAYRMRVVKLDGTVYPGQTIRVVYRRFVNGYRAVDIDATLHILEVTTEVGLDGVRVVAMELATTNAWPDSDSGFVTDMERRVSQLEAGEASLTALRVAIQFSSFVDIDSGTIDNVVIGGDSPAPGTFTALEATGNITVGGTVDGVDLAGFAAAQFLTLAASGHIANERILTPGGGLTGTDAGVGEAYTLAVGAGTLITVGADTVGLSVGSAQYQVPVTGTDPFTPSWVALSTYAGAGLAWTSNAYAVGAGDGIVVSANAVAVDLVAAWSGLEFSSADLRVDLGAAFVWAALHTFGAGIDVDGTLEFQGAESITSTAGDITVAPAGDLDFNPTNNFVKPTTGYDVNLGSVQKPFLTLHVAELYAQTLVAQDTVATIGGRVVVAPTTYLTRDIAFDDTTIYVKHNEMASGDRVWMEAHGWVEFMAITSSWTISTNLLSNGGFETPGDGGADIWANWTETAGDGALANETTLQYAGNDAMKATAGGSTLTYVQQDIVVTPGKAYRLRIWSRGDGTYAGRFSLLDVTNNVNLYYRKSTGNVTATYGLASRYFIAPPGCVAMRLTLYCPATDTGIAYFDEIHVGLAEYSYDVTRDLDETGGNAWSASDAVVNTGTAGDGFIDIYSIHGIKSASEEGPTIVGNVRNSDTYNDWTPHWAMGNLNGIYGYSATTYGAAFGKYEDDYITVEATNGIRIYANNILVGQWQTNADLILGQVATDKANLFWDQSEGRLNFRGGPGGIQVGVYVDTDGGITLIEGDVGWKGFRWKNDSEETFLRIYGTDTLGTQQDAALSLISPNTGYVYAWMRGEINSSTPSAYMLWSCGKAAGTGVQLKLDVDGGLTLVNSGSGNADLALDGDAGIGAQAIQAENLAGDRTLTIATLDASTYSVLEMVGDQTSNAAVGVLAAINDAVAGGSEDRLVQMNMERYGANNSGRFRLFTYDAGSAVIALTINPDGGIFPEAIKSGATQGAAGAAAGELWHDTDDDSIKIGV